MTMQINHFFTLNSEIAIIVSLAYVLLFCKSVFFSLIQQGGENTLVPELRKSTAAGKETCGRERSVSA